MNDKFKALNALGEEFHKLAVEKGWWGDPPDVPGGRNFGEILALIHSELSEALEAYRNGGPIAHMYTDGKPEGVPAEFADVLIRLLETCAAYKIDISAATRHKHEYNKTRPYRHGGKRA